MHDHIPSACCLFSSFHYRNVIILNSWAWNYDCDPYNEYL